MLKPLKDINTSDCRQLKYFFTDIDDTLTAEGMLPEYSFSSIWDLYRNKIKVIPVTGRPAGWCDHIARMWPVEAVIGENGAFYFSYNREEKKMYRRYFPEKSVLLQNRNKLKKIGERVLAEVPGSGISADQEYRIADLAIDFCEDVKRLNKDAVSYICRIIEEEGAQYKVSSIHINCWFGNFDKLSCISKYLQENTDNPAENLENAFFIGDSPNDEPIFKGIKKSIGVANILDFKDNLKHLPFYITEKRSASGFKEAADIIIRKKNS